MKVHTFTQIHGNSMKVFLCTVGVVLLSQMFIVTTASAQLVSCGDAANPCDFCDFVLTVDNIIGFIVGISVTLFLLVMVYAGFSLITSAGDTSKLDRAKRFITNGIIGIIIIMAGWFIVDTVLKLATGDELGVWNSFEGNCGGERAAGEAPEFGIESGTETYEVAFAESYEGSGVLWTDPVSAQDEVGGFDENGNISTGGAYDANGVQVLGGFDSSGNISAGGEYDANGNRVVGVQTTPQGSGMNLALAGGGTKAVIPCAQGASDRVTINFLGGSVTVHENVAPSLRRIDAAWQQRGGHGFYRVTSVGAYNCRRISGSNRLSVHSFGLAVDINPVQNPHTFPPQGRVTDMPPNFVNMFIQEGWGWGGNWNSSKDAMHFSKARGEQGDMRGE